MSDDDWNGVPDTSEHRSVGRRAWCFNDSEWCYRDSMCQCCDVTRVPTRWKGWHAGEVLDELRAQVKALGHALDCDSFCDETGHPNGSGVVVTGRPCDCFQADVLALLGGESDD
jgi:hypothetical protein